ncbi:UDP-N-acetylglucosamine 2-epimerase (hydrolyzing) [bacterium E08(2017)]|nr:UDP-N-acetylglucosamine 2-epimerase (hydrolyzing) [bacterium E08(2017)]
MKRKVCVVVTARPSYSRIKTALEAIKQHPDLELQLVVAASALLDMYGSAVQSIEKDGFDITAKVFMVMEGENLTSMPKTTGIGLMELSTVFDNLKPDVVVSVADRYETIATAIAASYMNIPVAHIQGGEVTGSIDEKVRHAITKLSDLHLVSTKQAAENVIRMGEEAGKVHVTGCPSIDLAVEVAKNPGLSFDPFAKYGGVGNMFDLSDGYVIVLQHPVTTEYQMARKHVDETLYAIKDLGKRCLWFWPNVDAGSDGTSKGIRVFRETVGADNIHFFKNVLPEEFLQLLCNCDCIVGNSSVAIRECSYLAVPAVNIGTRQNGRERGKNVIDVGYDRDAILGAIQEHLDRDDLEPDTLYGNGKAGERIASLLATEELTVEKRLAY